ncbi:DNA-directed RNA polymerase [Exophiala viscosa]|uniref:DNA-directed RNA polymerase n=1 Tax=Exophiala viscosa TaxID=2486360 RepID=A0AAN6E191_9EURO|nr:DNA-directed RNA polymerase [Exophiala viscosa]KAI1624356.1 DNA-directed RNA polymerase [Exophiala viscosa]
MVSSISMMVTAVFLVLATSVNAHMIMLTPTPYGKSTLNNSNLAPDGSDFPCKLRPGVYDLEGAENIMAVGSTYDLSFMGEAAHGGGSCQVSLTTDLQPSKDTQWSVIKSIEGGCPTNFTGNLGDDSNGAAVGMASVFNFTIPEGISPGQYTIAWSWVNRVGNREYYMNCGPATIIAPKKKRYAPAPIEKRDTSFPNLFVANLIGINNCVTYEDFDYVYPNPGSVVQSAGTGPYTTLSCAAATGNNAPQTPTATGPVTGSMTETAVATSATSASSPTFAGSSAAATTLSATSVQIVPVSTTSAATTPATSVVSSSSSVSGSAGAMSGLCSDEGAWACSADGSKFQRCASGSWSAVIQMPAGVSCSPGIADTLNETLVKD